MGVLYLVTLTLFLVHSDAFALFGCKAKVVEARMDATFSGFLQHLGAYFILGSLLICGFGGTFASAGAVHAFVFVHACATELLQAFVPQRTSDWRDLLANGIGVVLATAACTFVASRSLRKTCGPAAVLLLLVAACGCTDTGIEERSQPPTEQATAPAHSRTPEESVQAKLIRSTDWIGSGEWIKVDTHCHTRFSDGKHTIEEVVVKASEYGCDAVAITDHIDRLDREDIPPYLEAIDVARRQFPEILILVGLEWNVPPGGGDEHATVLFPDSLADVQNVIEFCELFDDHGREIHDPARATKGLAWLQTHPGSDGCLPVVILNHPSRKWDRSDEVYDYFVELAGTSQVMVGFSGAPGHQAGRMNGSYDHSVATVDRWDPVVLPGETWDRLLQLQHDVWAARAPSDFHRQGGDPWGDYWPGEFSETWLYVPERSTTGLLRAFEAGSFFAGHGGIVRKAVLTIKTDGLNRAAWAGETLWVPAGTTVDVQLTADVPETDLFGRPNRIDEVEFIIVNHDSVETFSVSPNSGLQLVAAHQVRMESASLAIRARGRRHIPDGPDLLFYTNPIRLTASTDVRKAAQLQ